MVRILHFLFGRLCFEIYGQNVERFLNLCARNHLVLWNLKSQNGGYSFFIRKSSYKMLSLMAQKTNVELKLTGEYGLPYFFREHRKRKILLFAVVFSVLTLFLLSQFLWEITISGNEMYSKSGLLKYVTTNFYRIGTYKKQIDCDELEEHLREDYDEIAWVSCSIQGTRLHIEMKETLDRKTRQNPKKPCDIIAGKNGIVTKLSVKSGTPLISVGDRVKKGMTLISGLIYYYSDDFQVTETDRIKADGDITIRTKEDYKDEIPEAYYEKKFKKSKKWLKSIYIGKFERKLPDRKKEKHTDVIERKHPLKIGKSFYLPVGVYIKTFRNYQAVRKVYKENEAERKLKERWQTYLEKQRKKGIQILHSDLNFKKKGNDYEAFGRIIKEERTGKIRNIKPLTKKQEEKIAPTTALQ